MTHDELIAEAERIASPTWDKPVKVGWHSSSLGYGHITVDGNDIADVQFYGDGDSDDPEQQRYFLDSVTDVVALVNEVNAARGVA